MVPLGLPPALTAPQEGHTFFLVGITSFTTFARSKLLRHTCLGGEIAYKHSALTPCDSHTLDLQVTPVTATPPRYLLNGEWVIASSVLWPNLLQV